MTVKWSEFIEAVLVMYDKLGAGQKFTNFDPASLTNKLDRDMYYVVGIPLKDEAGNLMKDQNGNPIEEKKLVKLGKGENMLAVCPNASDVEAYLDNTGQVVKLAGMPSQIIQDKSIEEFYVQWIPMIKDPLSVDHRGVITDVERFIRDHNDWKDVLEQLRGGYVEIIKLEPKCGGDFDKCEHEKGGTNLALKPIEMPGERGLFRKGVKSFTKWIWNSNFESTEHWNFPSPHYQVTPTDGPNGYFNDHCLIVKRITATTPAPTGMHQDLNILLNGTIRFGCHLRKISGPEDATVTIAIWSLTTLTPSSVNYRMPANEMYFDCYTDAHVEWEDLLRIEIYIPENSEYYIGGTYLLQQYTENEPEYRAAHPAPPHRPDPPEMPGRPPVSDRPHR